MKVSKALKMKNKLAGDVAKLKRRFLMSNSKQEGVVYDYDADAVYEELISKTQELIDLKTRINASNTMIQDKIYRISELKGLVELWNGVPTKSGTFPKNYGDGDNVFTSTFSQKDADAKISELEKQIDELQDEIDQHNYTIDL